MLEAYKSILILVTLIPNPLGEGVVLNVPFNLYSQICVSEGKNITYRMHDNSLKGKKAVCKVDYRLTDLPGNSAVKGEANVAENFAGNMGQDWETIKNDPRYSKHYSVTKAEKFATFDEQGIKTLYNGSDKDELSKFVQWDVEPIEEIEE